MIRIITLDELLVLHQLLLDQSGGMPGIRELGMLESAVAQPLMTFGGQDLYPTICDKAAALCFSLVMNHPFVDGNKRIGHAAIETFLVLNGYELVCPVAEQEQQILHLAEGRIKREEFTAWVRMHTAAKGSGSAVQDLANAMTPVVGSIAELAECPDLIGDQRAICYTPIDARHHHTRKTKHIVDGAVVGPVAGLAISQPDRDTSYYLCYCGQNWQFITDGWHATLDEAMRQAEFEYEGVSATWQHKQR